MRVCGRIKSAGNDSRFASRPFDFGWLRCLIGDPSKTPANDRKDAKYGRFAVHSAQSTRSAQASGIDPAALDVRKRNRRLNTPPGGSFETSRLGGSRRFRFGVGRHSGLAPIGHAAQRAPFGLDPFCARTRLTRIGHSRPISFPFRSLAICLQSRVGPFARPFEPSSPLPCQCAAASHDFFHACLGRMRQEPRQQADFAT
jgi:hypothetical protein